MGQMVCPATTTTTTTLVREWQEISRVSARESSFATETLSTPIPSIVSLAFSTKFQIWRVKVTELLIIIPRSLTCSLSSMFDHHIICRLLQILFSALFHIGEVRTCWHWTSYYLYPSICTAYVNHFVASVCPLHLLFLERFEYYLQSMILLSPLFRNLFQI